MPITPLRLLLIDDHEIIREGLRVLVERVPGWSVAGEAEEGLEGIRLALALQPDVVVTDMLMTGANGIEVAQRLRRAGFQGGIILLTAHQGDDLVRDAREAGIDEVLPKNSSFGQFSAAVGAAAQPHARTEKSAGAPSGNLSGVASLTPREREVLRLLARGAQSKEIGTELGISPRTVDVHRHRLQIKLRANGAAELTRIAVRAGLASL